ncbi:MAG: hypothetical protein R6V14_00595 [Halanaerobiales bacterium]
MHNVVEMVDDIFIGLDFNKIIIPFVNDVLLFLVSLLIVKIYFSNLYINLSRKIFTSIDPGEETNIPAIKIYGYCR